MKRIILTLLFVVVCSIGYVHNAFAFDLAVDDDPNNIINAPYFNNDVLYFGITSKNVNKYTVYQYTHANRMGSRTQVDTKERLSNTYFTGFGASCPGYYTVNLFNNSTWLGRVQFEVWANEFESIDNCLDVSPIEPTNPPTEPEKPEEPEEPTNPPTEPEKPDYCEEEGYDVNCEPIDWGDPGDGGTDYDPKDDCLYYPDLPICQEDKGDPPPEDNEDPYDRDGNGINDYLEQDWDDPKTVIPYCDQLIPGSNETFGEHPSVPCLEKDLDYENLPECDPEFIDWEPCREPGKLPWEEPYPEFDYPEEEPEEECAICSVFKCPGWDEYMGFLEDLADDIVGEINVPEVPEIPELDIPTGQEDPGLKDASFNADDIKNNSGEIQFREDPTGGFDITNPLESLPEDGSTAPRPSLETVPNPGAEEEGEGEISPPIPGGGEVTPPTPGGTVTPPTADGTAKYPGVP